MDENEFLAERFEQHRSHLRAVAYRLLGSHAEADDAVQEAWVRLARVDTTDVANLSGWLTTVVARVSLNMLRSRTTRREHELDEQVAEPAAAGGPEDEAVLADSVGLALLVVLDTLTPAERLAFVLHDMFAVPFDEVAEVLERSPAATRQLASRARRRVQGAQPPDDTDPKRRRAIVTAFLAASREGDFATLLSLLHPDVVLRADEAAVALAQAAERHGAPALASPIDGAPNVAEVFAERAEGLELALVDGTYAAAWVPRQQPRSVLRFTLRDGQITGIEVIVDRTHLATLDVHLVDNAR